MLNNLRCLRNLAPLGAQEPLTTSSMMRSFDPLRFRPEPEVRVTVLLLPPVSVHHLALYPPMASFVRTGKKIVAIGRNYVAHAKELGNATPKEPFFFLKPTSSYLPSGGKVEIPRGVVAHHEGD